jgi:hypothetical protein
MAVAVADIPRPAPALRAAARPLSHFETFFVDFMLRDDTPIDAATRASLLRKVIGPDALAGRQPRRP